MNLNEKIIKIAEYAGCMDEVKQYDEIIEQLNNSMLKNIAVIGETNCGKTTLINKLAGTEVRKATEISKNEPSMMVTFNSDEVKEGFEKHNVSNKKCSDAGIALYEIPVNDAIEYETGKITSLMEQMDAVIYVISAMVPLTASDIKNLDALSTRFPVIIFTAKNDLISDEDYSEVAHYITNSLSNKYEGIIFGFYDNKQEGFADEIVHKLGQLETDELREFHKIQLEQLAKIAIEEKLKGMETEMRDKRDTRVQEQADNDTRNRDRELEWNSIRLTMLEKKNEAIDYAAKKINKAEQAAEQEALAAMADAGNDVSWVKNDLKGLLENSVNSSSVSVMKEVGKVVDAHVAWLVSEVNHKFEINLEIQDMNSRSSYVSSDVGEYVDTRDYKKIIYAVGSGVVAGGAILSGLPLVPTAMVAVPATILMLNFAKGSVEDINNYHNKIKKFVGNCCSKTFARLKKQIEKNISDYYEKLIAEIVRLCESSETFVDFSDIDRRESEIKDKIAELNTL